MFVKEGYYSAFLKLFYVIVLYYTGFRAVCNIRDKKKSCLITTLFLSVSLRL